MSAASGTAEAGTARRRARPGHPVAARTARGAFPFLPRCFAAVPAAARSCLRAFSSRRAGGRAAACGGILRAGLAAIALLLTVAAGGGAATAQNVLVDNTGEARSNSLSDIFAQDFTAGSHTDGYILSSVGFRLAGRSGRTFTGSNYRVRILSDSSGSPGSTVVAPLDSPSSVKSLSVNVFTVPSGTTVTLVAGRKYWVEAAQTDGTGGLPDYRITGSNSQTGDTGWSIGNGRRHKDNTADSWTTNTANSAQIEIKGFRVNSAGDYTAPGLLTSDSSFVTVRSDGATIGIKFDENLSSTLAPASAFTVTADGQTHRVTRVRRDGTRVVDLTIAPIIRRGQTVSVQYTDPTSGDDANAIQDAAGNDAASFTQVATGTSTLARRSPDAPTGLTATWTLGTTQIDLSWTAPADYGGEAITGYRIERSADGRTGWSEPAGAPRNTDTDWSNTGLDTDTTWHYRVKAINSRGTGGASDVAFARTGNSPATGTFTIDGAARVGATLTAMGLDWADVDGLPPTADIEFQWFRVDGTDETAIAGATTPAYTPVAADAGKRIRIVASFTDRAGFDETIQSPALAVRAAMPPATCPAFSAPAGRTQIWTGTLTVGANQISGQTVNYGYRSGTGSLLPSRDIELGSGYSIDSLNVRTAALGGVEGQLLIGLANSKDLTAGERRNLRLHVCGETYALGDATNPGAGSYRWPTAGLDWSSVSTRVLYLTVATNNAATGAPAVAGTARVGETLSALTHAIRDADGLTAASYDYQWIQVDGTDETEISGETGRTYTLAADDSGKKVKVKVSFTDDIGSEETLTSAAFPAGTGTIAPVLAPMMEPGDIWAATLTVKDVGASSFGCSGTSSTSVFGCGNTNVLSETLGAADYDFWNIVVSPGGRLRVEFTAAPDSVSGWTLEVTKGSTTTVFEFSEATPDSAGTTFDWSSGLSWSAGDSIGLKIAGGGTGDITPPRVLESDSGRANAEFLFVNLDETIDRDNTPPGQCIHDRGRRQSH